MNTPVSLEIERLLIEKDIDMPVSPTIADVVMWLYKKHEIWIVVNISIQDMWYFELFNLKTKRNSEILTDDEYWLNSPTEAYSEAILYTLKNLI